MPGFAVTIVRLGDPPPWPGIDPELGDGEVIHLAALEAGMTSGATSLALRVDTDAGPVLVETSLAAWIAATCALRGAFPEAFIDTPLDPRPTT